MKLLARHIIALAASAILLALAGCSKSSSTDLLKKVPRNNEIVCQIDLAAIIESAGEKHDNGKIVLPEPFASKIPANALRGYEGLVNAKCVDLHNAIITGKYLENRNEFYGFVAVTDAKALGKYLVENDFTLCEEGETLTVYANFCETEANFVAVAEDFAMIFASSDDDFDGMIYATDILNDAAERNFADADAANYVGGHTISAFMSLPYDVYQNAMQMGCVEDCRPCAAIWSLDLKGLEAYGEARVLNSSDKVISLTDMPLADFKFRPTTINKKALAYMGKDDVVLYALSCKDLPWDAVFEALSQQMRGRQDRTMLAMIQPYIANIDGTVAFGAGGNILIDNRMSGDGLLKNASLTLVAQMKDKKAKEMVSQLKQLVTGFRMPIASTDDGFSLSIPSTGITVFIESHDDMLVVANHVIDKKDSYVVSSIDWGKYYGGLGFAANGNMPIFADNGLADYDISAVIYADSPDAIKVSVKCKGGDAKGLLEWFGNFGTVMQQKLGVK